MTTTAKNQYGTPAIGCYLDHANYSNFELSLEILDLAASLGMPHDAEIAALRLKLADDLADNEATRCDDEEVINYASEDAINWLNENEPRPFLYWANEGEANAFGLWPNVDSAREDCAFVSSKKMDTPLDGYQGEWLHINDHGNCTLYIRDGRGRDKTIWSVV